MPTEKVIPIFPLDLVLFPRQELPLRVFEPRYKQLVDDCMLGDGQFGACLVRDGGSVLGWNMPHSVGTIAKIIRCKDVGLDGLQLQIETVGRNPFRINEIIEPSIPQPRDYDPLSAEGHEIVSEMNDKMDSGGKMYIRAKVTMLPEIDGSIPLDSWENLVFLWKKNIKHQATSDDVTPGALDEMLRRFYLATDTPTAEYVYSLCALASTGPVDLQDLLEAESAGDLLGRAERLMRRGLSV